MPDITMCTDHNCPVKYSCYRYTAAPNPYRQSYFADSPRAAEESKCSHYWEDKYKSNNKSDSNDKRTV